MNEYTAWKILKHPNRLAALKMGQRIAPVKLQIGLTMKCNHNCPYCVNKEVMKLKAELPKNKIIEAIDDFIEMGGKGIELTGGGEPTIHPNFYEITDYIQEAGLGLGIITNGTELYPERLSEATWIRISIDAYSVWTYQKIHNVEMKFPWYTENPQWGKDTIVGASFIIFEDNYTEIYDFCKWCHELGFSHVRITPDIVDFARKLNRPADYEERYTKIMQEVDEQIDKIVALDYPDFAVSFQKYRQLPLKPRFKTCNYQQFITLLQPNGDFIYCCAFQNITEMKEKGTYGNIFEQRLKDIWWTRKLIDPKVCTRCVFAEQNQLLEYYLADNSELKHLDFP